LKEVVFDLLFEKQKAFSPEDPIEISEDLQREFQEKQRPEDDSNPKLLSLLKFANEQIRRQAEEIKKLQLLVPKLDGEEKDE
jgi:hypothetical protein